MPKQKYQKFITALLLCLSILLIVAGCSSDSAQKSNSTAAYTVTDSQGHKLYFKEKPQRIISTSISTDEILIDLVPSSRIAAFSRLVDDPGISNIVERAQSVGSRVDGQSSEAIMALHPDLILIPDFVKPEVIQSLRDMNLQVYVYKTPKSFEDVRECIRFLGEAVGEKERGEMMVTAMDEHLKKVQDKIGKIPKEKQKRIVFMRSNGAYYSPEASFNDVCRYAQVRNALEELHYDKPGIVNQEAVVQLNPEVFLLAVPLRYIWRVSAVVQLNPEVFLLAGWNYDGQHDPKQMEEDLLNNSGYQTTDAVKNRKVYTVPAKHVLCVSQYIVNAVEDLADAVYSK